MGCRLPKLRKAEERQSPGKIYSTLRRPQVETKVGVAYTYHFLDFLLGKEEVPVSSVLCLSSVRELPVQMRELYAQGFVLVAVHPFVHPCGPRHARIQRQLHRAVLLRETPQSSEKGQLKWAGHRLETDVCMSGHQAPDPEVIQNYVKRIQDASEQGVMFVGFLQQPGGGPCFLGSWDPEELSSLHSSPSPIHQHPFSSASSPSSDPARPPRDVSEPERTPDHGRPELSLDPRSSERGQLAPREPNGPASKESTDPTRTPQDQCDAEVDAGGQGQHSTCGGGSGVLGPLAPAALALIPQRDRSPPGTRATESTEGRLNSGDKDLLNPTEDSWSGPDSRVDSPLLEVNRRATESTVSHLERQSHNNNNHHHIWDKSSEKKSGTPPLGDPTQGRTQLFALYNYTGELEFSSRFYSLRVPLYVQKEAGLTTEVDAHWLDHMTQHFTSGARLIDGFFHLGEDNDNGISSVDSVFIFQNSAEETAVSSYDAIVVEQWTVVDGVVVRTDYIPLLQSLAPYGWRLMCVLPTPVVRTNSDGSLSTKQILFLQRPALRRKRKDFKMLNLRGRNKGKKNYGGEAPEKERESASPASESEVDELLGKAKEEEEEEEEREGVSTRGGEEARIREMEHETDPSLPSEGEVSDGDQEEADIDWVPVARRREKSVRWTDVCQRGDGGVPEETKPDERLKPQLSERALFSGVC